jgi:hypothetical protein
MDPQPIPNSSDPKWRCGDLPNTFALTFFNNVEVPIKVYYVVATDTATTGKRTKAARGPVLVNPESSASLPGMCIGQMLEFLVLGGSSTTNPLKTFYKDWPVVPTPDIPDAMYFSFPATAVADSLSVDTPPFTYQVEMSNKPTPGNRDSTGAQPDQARGGSLNPATIRFSRQVLCGSWFSGCPDVMDTPVSTCTGFWKHRLPCAQWCKDNPLQCDALKVDACNPQLPKNKAVSSFMVGSPECGCILRDASEARTPGSLDLTYGEFMQLLGQRPSIITKLPRPECYAPLCVEDGAILTTDMQAVKCPETISVCIALAKEQRFDNTEDTQVKFLNACEQEVVGGGSDVGPLPSLPPSRPPLPSPSATPALPPSSFPSPSPSPGPAPPPPPPSTPWFKTVWFIVVCVVVSVIIVGLGLGLGLGLKRRGNPQGLGAAA